MKSEFFMAVTNYITNLNAMAQCSFEGGYQRYGEICCLILQENCSNFLNRFFNLRIKQ